jgi:hypothetical protein
MSELTAVSEGRLAALRVSLPLSIAAATYVLLLLLGGRLLGITARFPTRTCSRRPWRARRGSPRIGWRSCSMRMPTASPAGPASVLAAAAIAAAGADAHPVGAQPRGLADAGLVTGLGRADLGVAAIGGWAPRAQISPAGAVAAVKAQTTGPIFNDYDFGGYLIYAGLKPFIDGRTDQLYGEAFTVRHHRAVTLQNVGDFVRLLDEHRIAVTLLNPATPAVGLLDRMSEWQRIYADEVAVVHVRRAAE